VCDLSLRGMVLLRWIVDVQAQDISMAYMYIDIYAYMAHMYTYICVRLYVHMYVYMDTRASLAIPLTYESAFLISLGGVFMYFSNTTCTGRRMCVYWNCPLFEFSWVSYLSSRNSVSSIKSLKYYVLSKAYPNFFMFLFAHFCI